jgi:hypothetical protein
VLAYLFNPLANHEERLNACRRDGVDRLFDLLLRGTLRPNRADDVLMIPYVRGQNTTVSIIISSLPKPAVLHVVIFRLPFAGR